MTKQATFWRRKGSERFAPLGPEFVNFDDKHGDVENVTEALGEDYVGVEKLRDAYESLGEILKRDGLVHNFTEGLLRDYEPVVMELTDEQYAKWRGNAAYLTE